MAICILFFLYRLSSGFSCLYSPLTLFFCSYYYSIA